MADLPPIQRLLAERQRVSRTLHDDIGQTLTAVLLELQYSGDGPVEPAVRDAVVEELRGAIGRLRDLSLGLASAPEDDASSRPG